MKEPSPRASRLAIAGALAALLVIGGGGFLLGRVTTPVAKPKAEPLKVPKPAGVALPPIAEHVLTRSDLIALGNAAADASASGMPLPASANVTPGQRFELYLPFGCSGPVEDDSEAALSWRYDEDASALRIHVAPTSWRPTDWWQEPPASLQAMEGFWIARPWSSAETCTKRNATAAPAGIDPITLPGQALGIAELITSETPRQIQRSERAYESVIRLNREALRVHRGLRLRLNGRIASFGQGRPVRCVQPGGADQRPICLIAVTLDEVAVENPVTQKTLAAWMPTAANPTHSAP